MTFYYAIGLLQGRSASDPKGAELSKCVKEFPTEQLKVSAGETVLFYMP